MKKDNSTETLVYFIKALNVKVTSQSIRQELELHPEYPGLLALSDVLKQWNIDNAAYAVSNEEVKEVPCPFIVQMANGEFTLVKEITKENVIVSNDKWNDYSLSMEEFKKRYGGKILIAEAEAKAGESEYPQRRRREILNNLRIPVVLTGLAIVLVSSLLFNSSYLSDLSWQITFLSLLKCAGLITTILLLIQSIDANNPLVQRLCTGNNKDCNAILSSKEAKITEELSWSELGFFYFAGTGLTVLFNSGSFALMQTIAVINMLCLPYTAYSLYYQFQKKQWCILCCTIQALFWLEFFTLLPYFSNQLIRPTVTEWSSLMICMSVPVLSWIFMKPYFLKDKQLQPLKQQLRRFKYSSDLFNKLLENQPSYVLPEEQHSVILGNRESENIITMVSNPYCQPCAKAHKTLEEWLEGRDDIQLRVIFTTQDKEGDRNTPIAGHLMRLRNQNEKTVRNALHDWYSQEQKNYDSWASTYPLKEQIDVNESLEKQRQWCKMAEVKGTPTILINGHRLPKPYQLEDIKYFI